MYSQWEEEKAIVDYFGKGVGRFLDIGAYNGVSFSNTKRLVELGWSGVCVEPASKPFESLQRLHANTEGRVKCVNVAVTPSSDGAIRFWETEDAVSTSQAAHKELWSKVASFEETRVVGWSVGSLLANHPGPYDFVNIDTEGTSVDIALKYPLPGLQLICIEHNNRLGELQHWFIVKAKFRIIYQSYENIIFGR